MNSINILDKVIEIFRKYSLCDRCLGRLFGYLGKDMSNEERGKALKTVALLEIHRKLQEGSLDTETAKIVLLNMQKADIAKHLGIPINGDQAKSCFICGNMINKWIEEFSQKITSILSRSSVSSFIVGVTSAHEYLSREEILVKEFGLTYRETIKRELKREIGKKVSTLINIKPDFEKPEIIAIVDLMKNDVKMDRPSLILYGYYWKLGRMISQNIWIGKDGRRRYELAIEDVVKHVGDVINAKNYKLHIGGREDADVRILGSGKPIAIEFKVSGKEVDIGLIERMLNSYTQWLKFKIEMRVNRRFIARLKEAVRFSKKMYRAIIYTSTPIDTNTLFKLETVFKDRVVEQRTPARILGHKKDRVRRRKVYHVKILPIAPQVFEALIECDGGLYVKELVSGDGGRTRPSFSEILGCETRCVMLDVLYVHEYI